MELIDKVFNKFYSRFNVGQNNYTNLDNWVSSTLLNLKSGLTILDAGAGELRNKKHCTHLKYISQDFCQYDGKGDTAGLQEGTWDTSKIDIVSDITNIPKNDKSFDVVLCSEVFEHIPNPVEALKEFARLLKKDGKLILTAPVASLTHFAPYHFYSGFNKYFYQHHLKELGFEIECIKANGNYFEEVASNLRNANNMGGGIFR